MILSFLLHLFRNLETNATVFHFMLANIRSDDIAYFLSYPFPDATFSPFHTTGIIPPRFEYGSVLQTPTKGVAQALAAAWLRTDGSPLHAAPPT